MPTPQSQRADQRPISFVLHDTAAGSAPTTFPMIIRPEDLTRSEPSRLSVHQVFGGDGGFVDSFGPGIGTLQISGHTGWRGNATADGAALFERLHTLVFQEWHAARSRAVGRNQDPDGVKLIFVDALDNFAWVCAPQQFVLRRNRARPLLAQFQITLLKLGDDVSYIDATATNGAGLPRTPMAAMQQRSAALVSLRESLSTMDAFVRNLAGGIGAALGSITAPLLDFTRLAVAEVRAASTLATGGSLDLARQLTLSVVNVTNSLSALAGLPGHVRGQLLEVSAAFRNAFCLLGNVLNRTMTYSDYSPFYGASNCSSTWDGGVISPFSLAGTSGIAALFPPVGASGAQTPDESAALRDLATMDTVLNRKTPDWMASHMMTVVSGG